MNNETIQLVCIVVIAVSVAVQAIIMLVMFLGITKGLLALKQEVDDMKTSVTPTVEKARVFMDKPGSFCQRLARTRRGGRSHVGRNSR